MASTVAGKLRRMLILTSGGVLLLAALVFCVLEAVSTRYYLIERVNTLSTFLSMSLRPALQVNDVPKAQALLQTLRTENDLAAAYIYRLDGSLFARYQADSTNAFLPAPSYRLRSALSAEYQFKGRYFEFAQPVRLQDELVGQLYFQYSLATVVKHLLTYLLVVLIIYLLAMAGVYSVSFRLQRRISGPIERILEAMQAVTQKQHFGVRIRPGENDEIGAIINGFNEMIATIDHSSRELEAQRKEIEKHVFYDALTGLPNRRLLVHKTEQEMVRARRTLQKGALLYLDLDHFKTINDSLGHQVGDAILKIVSARIRQVVREVDTPARFGGDEFVILLPEVGRDEVKACSNVSHVAEKVRQVIAKPYKIEDRTLYLTPSIGIVLFDAERNDFEALIVQADLAMYRAKDEGRNQAQFFAPYMQDSAEQRQKIEESLRAALLNNALQLFYQPQVDTEGNVVSAEALVRWKTADNLWLSPASFIPIAELSDLICSVGRWVLTAACERLSIWEKQGRRLSLAVNISPREFHQAGFVEQVEEIILNTGVNPERLVLELTEGVLLGDIEATIEKMNRLCALGISFSIDDFGTGYSSLQYLKELPLSTLKIDQSFVREIVTDTNDAAIVTTIIAMSRHLGLKVIAEGVEQESQQDFLREHGCDLFQGYLYGRPEPLRQFEQLLTAPTRPERGAGKPSWLKVSVD